MNLHRIGGIIVVTALLFLDAGAAIAQRGDSHFRVESEAGKNRRGKPIISGYVYNDYGNPAGKIQLLIEALDAQGQVTGKNVVPVIGFAPVFNRLYFEVPARADAVTYRVSVYSFEWFARGE